MSRSKRMMASHIIKACNGMKGNNRIETRQSEKEPNLNYALSRNPLSHITKQKVRKDITAETSL